MKLTEELIREMKWLLTHPKNGGSERSRDRNRTKLKKLGLIHFDRAGWQWVVTDQGRAALTEAKQ